MAWVWILGFLHFAASNVAAQPSESGVRAIVDQFVPVTRLELEPGAFVSTCYVVVERDAVGDPTVIMAMYTTGVSAAARVLMRDSSGQFQVSAESENGLFINGDRCELTRENFDGDSLPDIFAYLEKTRGSQGWAFEWNGATLETITPAHGAGPGIKVTAFREPSVYDLEHDGRVQVFCSRAEGDARTGDLYRLSGSQWDVDPKIKAVWSVDGADAPVVTNVLPSVAGSGPYVLRLINGERDGTNRLSGISLRVNGAQVLALGVVTGSTEMYEVELGAKLPAQATIEATIQGPSDARMVIVFENRGL